MLSPEDAFRRVRFDMFMGKCKKIIFNIFRQYWEGIWFSTLPGVGLKERNHAIVY